jgi:hypothetical protein
MNNLHTEHCYSGFMGYEYIAFLWDGNKLVAALCRQPDGSFKIIAGVAKRQTR